MHKKSSKASLIGNAHSPSKTTLPEEPTYVQMYVHAPPVVLSITDETNHHYPGAGRLDVLTSAPEAGRLTPCWSAPWPDVVTDVTWSETSPSTLVAATGDRAVVAFDTAKPGVRGVVRTEVIVPEMLYLRHRIIEAG